MEKASVRLRIEGMVQGVYFRWHTRERALELGVHGWVRNLLDGAVEAVAEGEREAVEKLVEWCRQGPREAVVQHVETEWAEWTGRYHTFEIRH